MCNRCAVIPDGYTIQEIQDKDFEFIGCSWPYYSNLGEGKFFKHVARKYGSAAVYKDGKIVSWVFESSIGSLVHLFTVPEHRGKGLATIVIQEMCKKIIVEGRTPFCFIVPGNKSSENVFGQLGFKRLETPRKFICINLQSYM